VFRLRPRQVIVRQPFQQLLKESACGLVDARTAIVSTTCHDDDIRLSFDRNISRFDKVGALVSTAGRACGRSGQLPVA
jgi:hypothetical protein